MKTSVDLGHGKIYCLVLICRVTVILYRVCVQPITMD